MWPKVGYTVLISQPWTRWTRKVRRTKEADQGFIRRHVRREKQAAAWTHSLMSRYENPALPSYTGSSGLPRSEGAWLAYLGRNQAHKDVTTQQQREVTLASVLAS